MKTSVVTGVFSPNYWTLNLMVAAAYYIGGQSGLLLTSPPNTASPIWPPAGIALVVALLYGYRVLPGLIVGSFLVQLFSFFDVSADSNVYQSLLVGLFASAGSVLQAYVGAWLIQRFLGSPLRFFEYREIIRFMLLGGPVACVVAASVGVLTLLGFGALPLAAVPAVWGTWWVGDTIGVLVLAPIVIGFLGDNDSFPRRRRITLTVSVLLALLLVIGFFTYSNHQVKERVASLFQEEANAVAYRMETNLDHLRGSLEWSTRYRQAAGAVSNEDFERFHQAAVDQHPDIRGYHWLQTAADGGTYVSSHRLLAENSAGCGDIAEIVPLPVEPGVGLRFFRGPSACVRMFVFQPVAVDGNTATGLVALELDSDGFFAEVFEGPASAGVGGKLSLKRIGEPMQRIYEHKPWPDAYEIQSVIDARVSRTFQLGDATLILELVPEPAYGVDQYRWGVWFMLVLGLVFASFLSIGLMAMTGRNIYTENTVKTRTEELAAENEERKRTERLLNLQNSVLEMIARDEPLNPILNRICRVFESVSRPGTNASVMLVDRDRKTLNIAAAPRLSDNAFQALMEFPIGNNQASCGTAVFRGEVVVVDDVSTSPLWGDYCDFALKEGLKACWSMPFFSKSGEVLGSFALSQTVSRKPTEYDMEHLKASAFLCSLAVEQAEARDDVNKLTQAVEQSPSAVIMTDRDGSIEYVNRRFTELTQYEAEEAHGHTASELLSKDLSEVELEEIWDTLLSGSEWRGTLKTQRKDGSKYWAQYYMSPVRNHANEIIDIVAIHDDVTELRRNTEKITYQATHDLLTGLVNRPEFERQLDVLLTDALENGTVHTLCFIDLDQFKIVNDSSGHVAGDELLRQLGTLLLKRIRQRDILARLGGDEFGILLEDCSIWKAMESVEQLRETIEEHPFVWGERTFNVGMSAGLVEINADSPNRIELLREADAACYAAKDRGRNRIHVYRANDATTARRSSEIRWATDIREALSEDRFVLYQQPIRPVQEDGGAGGCEILLRMVNKDGTLVLPGEFLPAAERYNIAPRIDAWVVEHTFRKLAANRDYLERWGYVSINLSGLSLEANFALEIVDWLEKYALPAEKVCLEITETAAIRNLAQAFEFIETLGSYQVKFALDDFGTGLSSFAYLKNLPVDFLKIDGQFVADMLEDPIDLAMVKSINEIGKVMGKTTIAEFVENELVLDQLRQMGVDYAQGYGIARPEEFLAPDSEQCASKDEELI